MKVNTPDTVRFLAQPSISVSTTTLVGEETIIHHDVADGHTLSLSLRQGRVRRTPGRVRLK